MTQYLRKAEYPLKSMASGPLKIEKGTRPVLILATHRHATESVLLCAIGVTVVIYTLLSKTCNLGKYTYIHCVELVRAK